MSWTQRIWEAHIKRQGVRVSVNVPVGVNPFRDLWNLLVKKSARKQERRRLK